MSCSVNRRRFLQQSGCGLFTLAALGVSSEALSLPVTFVEGMADATEQRYPIPTADGVSIDRRAQVIVVRYANKMYAMALACPHENAAVKWLPSDGRFQCTKHDSQYTPEGTYRTGHATRNLDRFPIRRDGTSVVVAVDRVFRSDQALAAWNAAFVEVA